MIHQKTFENTRQFFHLLFLLRPMVVVIIFSLIIECYLEFRESFFQNTCRNRMVSRSVLLKHTKYKLSLKHNTWSTIKALVNKYQTGVKPCWYQLYIRKKKRHIKTKTNPCSWLIISDSFGFKMFIYISYNDIFCKMLNLNLFLVNLKKHRNHIFMKN